MVFNEYRRSINLFLWTNRSSIAALNGIVYSGQLTTIPLRQSLDLLLMKCIIEEQIQRKYNISNIAGRNTGGYSVTGYFDQGLVNTVQKVNDVAMTVLPNAPIDMLLDFLFPPLLLRLMVV